jgi:hypothetical protein
MNTVWSYGRCVSVLNGEIALLERISGIQNAVRQAVLRREWTDFEWKIAEINQAALEFEALEAERAGLFAGLERAGEKKFYALAARLPEEERRELSGLYRTLKMEIYRMRALNESFMGYVTEAKTVAAAYMDAVFPARGGKVYTRKGGEAARELKSMVLRRLV